jgi:hypothetical protein
MLIYQIIVIGILLRNFSFVKSCINISADSTKIMFGKKHCPVCGIDVNKQTSPERFGKYFCSDAHVQQYTQIQMERKKESNSGGCGCC